MLSLIIVVSVPFAYSYYQQKENEGVCWRDMRRLSDDELYQRAMLGRMQEFMDTQVNREQEYESCRRRDDPCKAWFLAEPLNVAQIQQKIETLWGYDLLTILANFKSQPLNQEVIKNGLKQGNNSFTIFHTLARPFTTFIPKDCCEILSLTEIEALRIVNNQPKSALSNNLYTLDQIRPESQHSGTRYISIKRYWSPINAGGRKDSGLINVYSFAQVKKLNRTDSTYTAYLPLSNCGEILDNEEKE